MDKIPMWIQKAIAIFIIYVVVIAFSTIDGGWEFYFNPYRPQVGLDVDGNVLLLIIIGIPFSLAVSWLIENIKRK